MSWRGPRRKPTTDGVQGREDRQRVRETYQQAMKEMKKRYDTVNEKLWSLETRIETMSKEQSESSGAIQSKLDVLLRNSIAQDKLVVEKPPETKSTS